MRFFAENGLHEVLKIHRLIRDIKGPLEHSCNGVLLKAQVLSSYIWSVHNKPFGTGLFGTVKELALDGFLSRHTINSPLFQKYLARIGQELDMPTGTEKEQLEIMRRLRELRSFRKRLQQSKLGRWFSWNGCAHENMPEFSATNMVLEHHLLQQGGGLEDPDDSRVAFDDLQKAAKAPTPQAELSRLRSAGGGLRPAYKLMSADLLVHCKLVYIVTQPA